MVKKSPSPSAREDRLVAIEQFVDVLNRMPEFQTLDRSDLESLAKLGPRIYKRGEALITGDSDNVKSLVILLAGVVDIEKSISVAGSNVWVCINKVQAPALLGEVGVFSSRPRIAAVVSAQRSVAMVATEKALKEIFGDHPAVLAKLFLNFARLGAARCRSTANSYFGLTDKMFQPGLLDSSQVWGEIERIDDILFAHPEGDELDIKVFHETSDLLEKLDETLALARYINLTPDFTTLQGNLESDETSGHLSRIASEAIKSASDGAGSVKEALYRLCGDKEEGTLAFDQHVPFLQKITKALDELLEAHYHIAGQDNGSGQSSSSPVKMIDEYAGEINAKLDYILQKVTEDFGLDGANLTPAGMEESRAGEIAEKICKEIESLGPSFNVKHSARAYFDKQSARDEGLRNNLALAMFVRIKYHPVIKFIMLAKCPPTGSVACTDIFDNIPFMSDFVCLGCRISANQAKQNG